MGARNDPETLQMFTPALIAAMKTTVDLIMKYNVQIVEEAVYAKGPAGLGGRTRDLQKAWKTSAGGGAGHAFGKFEYDPSKMNFHPSVVKNSRSGNGVKEGLIEIVYHGLAGNFGWPPVGPTHASQDYRFAGRWWATSRNAWALLIQRLGKRRMRQFVEEGFASSGLRYRYKGGDFKSNG